MSQISPISKVWLGQCQRFTEIYRTSKLLLSDLVSLHEISSERWKEQLKLSLTTTVTDWKCLQTVNSCSSPEWRIIEIQNTPEIENISHPLISLCHCTQRPQKCKQMQPLSTLAPLNCSKNHRNTNITTLFANLTPSRVLVWGSTQSVKSKSQVSIGWSCLLHIPSTTGVRSLFVMRHNTLSFLCCSGTILFVSVNDLERTPLLLVLA